MLPGLSFLLTAKIDICPLVKSEHLALSQIDTFVFIEIKPKR